MMSMVYGVATEVDSHPVLSGVVECEGGVGEWEGEVESVVVEWRGGGVRVE
jgi:hypothetical protein